MGNYSWLQGPFPLPKSPGAVAFQTPSIFQRPFESILASRLKHIWRLSTTDFVEICPVVIFYKCKVRFYLHAKPHGVIMNPTSFLVTGRLMNRAISVLLRCFCLAFLFSAAYSQNSVSFDLSNLDAPRRGNIGFLNGLGLNPAVWVPGAFPKEWLTEIKPLWWRGTIGTHNRWNPPPGVTGLDGYAFLKNEIGVSHHLRIVWGEMRAEPYRTISSNQGLEAAAAALARDTREKGLDIEWDIRNEPNWPDTAVYMKTCWNPIFRGLRIGNPKAIIHGPSISYLDSVYSNCHGRMFEFLEAARSAGTLPDYVNWHINQGRDIAANHGALAAEVRLFYRRHGASLLGTVCGETVRPGDERNTSPAVAIDVFAASEVYDVPQIHTCWGSVKIYGQDLNRIPTICGLLNKDWTGRRGVWWTYRFFAGCAGKRVRCTEGDTGTGKLVALAFADVPGRQIRALVGVRDTVNGPVHSSLELTRLSQIPGLVIGGKVNCRIWDNPQTEEAVVLTNPTETLILTVTGDSLKVERNLPTWGAMLVEIGCP